MIISENRFETSDIKTRKRHEVILSVDSPASEGNEIALSVKTVVHTNPTEKAFEAKKNRTEAANEVVTEVVAPFVAEAQEEPVAVAACEVAPDLEEVTEDAPVAVEAAEEITEEVTEEEAAPVVADETEEFVNNDTKEEPVKEEPKKKKRRFRLSLTTKKALSGWLFVLPFVLGIILVYAPIVWNSLRISLTTYTPIPGGMQLEWNNFAN